MVSKSGLPDEEKVWPSGWQSSSKRRRPLKCGLILVSLLVLSTIAFTSTWQSVPADAPARYYRSWKQFVTGSKKIEAFNAIKTSQVKSSIVKVTGLYGVGSWLPPSEGQVDTHSMYMRSLKLHKEHSRKHGHEQVIATKQLFGTYVDNAYTKIGNLIQQNLLQMQKLSVNETRWLFWHDADTVVTNREVSLDLFVKDVEKDQRVQLLYTADQNGLNAGVFFLRVGEWASLFLASILARSKAGIKEDLGFWEQTAMSKIITENAFFGNASVEIPRSWCNNYAFLVKNETTNALRNPFAHGDFLVHLVAGDKHKKGWFDFFVDIGEGQDQSYHSQTAAIKLGKTITAFWANRTMQAR